MVDHGRAAVWRDDGEIDPGVQWHGQLVRPAHGAGVEGGDLVVVAVGDDVRLRGKTVGQLPDVSAGNVQRIKAVEIALAVRAQGAEDERVTPQQRQAVGDIARAPAKLAPHGGHQKADVQNMHFVGQDVLGKAAVEGGDGVEGERTADEGGHEF